MAITSHKRQIIFFLAAVLLPCLVLVILSFRMIAQQKELAEKRLTDERRTISSNVRQQLLVRLERLKSEEVAAFSTGGKGAGAAHQENSPVALTARLEGRDLVLPWQSGGPAEKARRLLDQGQFAASLRQGEQLEFRKSDNEKAAARYGKALRIARDPLQGAYAELSLARVQTKLRQQRSAQAIYRKLLKVSWGLTDTQGIPLSLYAASGLLQTGTDPQGVQKRIEKELNSLRGYSPAVAYLLRDILQMLAESAPAPVAAKAKNELQTTKAHIRYAEQVQELKRDFPNLGLEGASTKPSKSTDPLWAFYGGAEPWLVSVAPASSTRPPIVIAVRAEEVFRSLRAAGTLTGASAGQAQLHGRPSVEGEALGPNFPGLRISFAEQNPAALARQWRPERAFYLVTLLLVLSITLFGAYLLWRDVRREVRLAEMRSQFVSSVSHELKTPLTAIRMFAETLGMGHTTDPRTQSEYLETIISETERLTRLLNNVLDFSKIEQGRRTYRLEPTSLAEVVQAAARTMQYPLAQQGFQLQVDVEDNLPVVRADADAIEQAILNLLANAMKYSGDTREINLRLLRKDGSGVIQVTDRGVGIPPAEQARIFEKFYRAPTPENQRLPGTGLGLTLVEHIAKAHGGRVEVQSEPGKGSTFSIDLPLEGAA